MYLIEDGKRNDQGGVLRGLFSNIRRLHIDLKAASHSSMSEGLLRRSDAAGEEECGAADGCSGEEMDCSLMRLVND